MQPVMSKSLSVTALALRDLIFMVREDQILPTGMNIDFLTQIFFCHHRTLDVPSRTSFTPWRYPERFSFFFRFPQDEIQRIFFLIFAGHQKRTITGSKIIQIFVG